MSPLLLEHPAMPRQNKTKRNDKVVKIDKDLAVKAKFIAQAKGIQFAEYLSSLLRPLIEKEFPKILKSFGQSTDVSLP